MWTALIGGAMALGGGIAGALSGGDSGGGNRLKYTPEYELQMLRDFQTSLTRYDNQIAQNRSLLTTYNNRMAMVDQWVSGTMPSKEALANINQSTMDIVSMMGGDAKKAIESGFLDEQTAKMSGTLVEREGQMFNANQEELDALKKAEATDFRDPRYEQQVTDQRRQLEQELARGRVSPAQRAIALRQFEDQVESGRFTRAEELRTGLTQRTMARMGARGEMLGGSTSALGTAGQMYLAGRQQRFGETMQQFGGLMQYLGFTREGAGALAATGGARFTAGTTSIGTEQATMAARQGAWSQLGQTDLTDPTQHAIESGLVGPGSMAAQTGVPRRKMDEYGRTISEGEAFGWENRGNTISPETAAQYGVPGAGKQMRGAARRVDITKGTGGMGRGFYKV